MAYVELEDLTGTSITVFLTIQKQRNGNFAEAQVMIRGRLEVEDETKKMMLQKSFR
jgi:hypothetical protein